MKDFGYTINPDRQIDYDANSRQLADSVISKEATFNVCMSCGSCTATCSAGVFTDFNLRKIFVLIKRGETSTLKEEMKKCMLCGKCQLICPRGVNTRKVILSIHKALESHEI
jgi:heterodisulfide reductase subunit C